jgi:hypothetical protein
MESKPSRIWDKNDFVDAKFIGDYLCILCSGVYFDPVNDIHGHCFCRSCIETNLKKTSHCPIGNELVSQKQLITLPFITQTIYSQKVFCKNTCYGCGWTGPVKDFELHKNTDCRFQTITCQNKGCGIQYFRKDEDIHRGICNFRLRICPFCGHSENSEDKFFEHINKCDVLPVYCTQDCLATVVQNDMKKHIDEVCPNTTISCFYKKLGCEISFTRKDILRHEGIFMSHHLTLVISSVTSGLNLLSQRVLHITTYFRDKFQKTDLQNENQHEMKNRIKQEKLEKTKFPKKATQEIDFSIILIDSDVETKDTRLIKRKRNKSKSKVKKQKKQKINT